MKKLIYANDHFKLPEQNDLFDNLNKMRDYNIIITGSVPLPRHTDTTFSKSVFPLPMIPYARQTTFADATNLRAQEIAKYAERNDLPIVAMWSGGIDSTVILSAVLQNFSKPLLDRLVIRMSNASYVENPEFYRKVIVKNNIEHHNCVTYDYNNAIILHGDPADALWLGGNILNLEASYPGCHNLNFHHGKGKGIILEHLTDTSNVEYAGWLYEQILTDSRTSGIELYTIADFFWWIIFNYNFSPMCLKHVGEVKNQPHDINLANYEERFINWFKTDAYQEWSMQAQANYTKFDGTTRSYKMEAKQYIYEYDKNQWYRDYKTKVHSQYMSQAEDSIIGAIYEDGEIIISD